MKFGFGIMAVALALMPAAVPATADDTANTQVVQAYYAAVNAADIDQAATFLAQDVVFINPTGSYSGLDAVRKSLDAQSGEGLTFDLSKLKDDNGRVTYDYAVKVGDTVLDSGTNGLTIVKDGKIVFDGTTDTEAFWRP
jgi:ketosteroid isomerase-like protein